LNEEAVDDSVSSKIEMLGAGLCSQGFLLVPLLGILVTASALLDYLMMFSPWLVL